MPYVYFDSAYAPCGFLIVRDGANPYSETDTVLIQTDWDYPGIASRMGFVPCECGETDGTIDCSHHKAGDMISAAYDWIAEHESESFPELADYFA